MFVSVWLSKRDRDIQRRIELELEDFFWYFYVYIVSICKIRAVCYVSDPSMDRETKRSLRTSVRVD
jgi:hypothetical protein